MTQLYPKNILKKKTSINIQTPRNLRSNTNVQTFLLIVFIFILEHH